MIDRIQFSTGPASGTAGAASATGFSSPAAGRVLAVMVEYNDSPPASTDFTLQDEEDPANENIVNLTNTNSDTKLYPRRTIQSNSGTDITYDGVNNVYEPYVIHGRLTATISQANSGDSCTVTVWIER